jgi:hypothetical protein
MVAMDPEQKLLRPAKKLWKGTRSEFEVINGRKVGTVMFLHEGELQAYIMPIDEAEALNHTAPVVKAAEASVHHVTGYIRAFYTHLRPGFWPVAFFRDVVAWNTLMPGYAANPMKPIRYLKAMYDAFRPARESFKATSNKVAQDALRRMMVIAKRDRMGLNDIQDDYEYEIASFGMNPQNWNREAKKIGLGLRAWSKYKDIGQIMERWHKIAGMLYLDEHYADLPEWKKQEIVRERAGSPDFLQKPGMSKANMLLLFYNPWKEGIRSMVSAAKDDKWEFSANMATTVIMPSVMQAIAVKTGMGNDDWEEQYRRISWYDLTNYICIPVGWADEKKEKVAYIRLPLWEPARVLHGMIFNAITGGAGLSGSMNHAGGQLPGLNPLITAGMQQIQYQAMGKNPYVSYTGSLMMTEEQMDAGGWAAQKELLRESSNLTPLSIVHRWMDRRPGEPEAGKLQKFLEAPFMSDTLGRWVKVSDRGLYDEDQRGQMGRASVEARTKIAVREIIGTMMEPGFERLSDSDKVVMRDPFAQQYMNRKLPEMMKGRSSQLLRRLERMNSRGAKVDLLQREADRRRDKLGDSE